MDVGTVRARAWAWYLAAAVFATQYYAVSAYGATADDTLYLLIGASAVMAGVVGLFLGGGEFVVGRVLLVGSIITYLAADAVLANLEDTNLIVPFPSLADWLYLAVYPALVLAGILIVRRCRPSSVGAVVAGGVAAFVAAAAVLWWWYGSELWNSPFLDETQRRVAVAYPLGDALAVAAGVAALVAGGRRIGRHTLFAGAAMALAVANLVYNVEALGDGHEAGGLASVGWLAFTALLGGAALCPRLVGADQVAPDDAAEPDSDEPERAEDDRAEDDTGEMDAEEWLDSLLASEAPVLTDV